MGKVNNNGMMNERKVTHTDIDRLADRQEIMDGMTRFRQAHKTGLDRSTETALDRKRIVTPSKQTSPALPEAAPGEGDESGKRRPRKYKVFLCSRVG